MPWYDEAYERLLATLRMSGEVDDLDDAEERDAREAFARVFGTMFDGRTSLLTSARAEDHYARERPASVLVLSQHDSRFTPHGATSPVGFALLCTLRAKEAPPSVTSLHALEPLVVANDFGWAMVHTHEDDGHGGPYFVRAEKISPNNGPRPYPYKKLR